MNTQWRRAIEKNEVAEYGVLLGSGPLDFDVSVPLSFLLMKSLQALATGLLDPKLDVDFLRLALLGQEAHCFSSLLPDQEYRLESRIEEQEPSQQGRVLNTIVDWFDAHEKKVASVGHRHLVRSPHAHVVLPEQDELAEKLVVWTPTRAQLERYAQMSGDTNPVLFDEELADMNGFAKPIVAPHALMGALNLAVSLRFAPSGHRVSQMKTELGVEAYLDEPIEIAFGLAKGSDSYIATLSQPQGLCLRALCQVVQG